jgi:hypothetical protein
LSVGSLHGAGVVIARIFVLMVNHVGVLDLLFEIHFVLEIVKEWTINLVLRVGQTAVILAYTLLRLLKLLFGCAHVVVAEQLRLLFIMIRQKPRHLLPLKVVEVSLVASGAAFFHQCFAVFPVALSHSSLLILRQRVEDCVDVLHLLLFKHPLCIRHLHRCLVIIPLLLLFEHLSLMVPLHVH